MTIAGVLKAHPFGARLPVQGRRLIETARERGECRVGGGELGTADARREASGEQPQPLY